MTPPRTPDWTRRATLGGLAAGVGAGLAGFSQGLAAAEPPPETTRIRLLIDSGIPILCWAPQYIALDLLRIEGFSDVEVAAWRPGSNEGQMLADRHVDIAMPQAADIAHAVDRGLPVTALGGLHVGCIEVFASDRVKGLNDLAGARMLTTHAGGDEDMYLSTVLSHVGLDPRRDVEWVYETDFGKWTAMFERGEVDVVLAFAPLSYRLHERGVGHVILNMTTDEPWRHFYCCMIAGNTDFVRANPVATKRALRALIKAQELCATDPEGSATRLVEMGVTERRDFATRLFDEVPYGAWRDFDPAASLRFYALRMHEAGLIGTTPNEILARGADFSFVDELRRELKT